MLFPSTLVALVWAIERFGAPALVLAAAVGASFPPITVCMRTYFRQRLADELLLATAYSLESVLIELVFILGPMLVALLVAVASPGAAVLAAAACGFAGTLLFLRSPALSTWRVEPRTAASLLGPLAALLKDSGGRLHLTANGVRNLLDGIDARLDERRDTSRYLIALLIFLGLLGTFWGLLMTAGSVGETIRGLNVANTEPAQMFETLRAGLEAPLSGMGTAFSTSLFGLASSLVLGFLDLQASQAQNRFANDLEAWLSAHAQLDGGIGSAEGGAAPSRSRKRDTPRGSSSGSASSPLAAR